MICNKKFSFKNTIGLYTLTNIVIKPRSAWQIDPRLGLSKAWIGQSWRKIKEEKIGHYLKSGFITMLIN
jgi:hypothetical protein